MAGVYRKPTDRDRGKAGKWTAWWVGADGRRRSRVAYTDKTASLEFARAMDTEARRVRDGLVDPGERKRREESLRPIADHIEDYRRQLLAKGNTANHAGHTAGVLRRLLSDAAVAGVADLVPERIQAAIGRLRVVRSARTCNHATGAVKAFAAWLEANGRIAESPKGLATLAVYNQKADRRRVRRAITPDELARLLAATEAGPDHHVYGPTKSKILRVPITGSDRAAIYRLAMGTGFRANELRSLTPECFALDGDAPTVTCPAGSTKNGKEAVQPITRELAGALRPFVAGKPPGEPVLIVPEKTAKMLRADLAAALIPHTDPAGRVVDFHALRAAYITHLIKAGVNPKIVQTLARHSTITLTLDLYTTLDEGDTRGAIESLPRNGSSGPSAP